MDKINEFKDQRSTTNTTKNLQTLVKSKNQQQK